MKAAGVTVGVASLALMGGTVAQFGNEGTTVDPVHPRWRPASSSPVPTA
ncbi:hypothetical protein G7085_15460 [Tessaracoccus sp. HDW20]|nr:hypothetical protein [Tessaracoccus coleopterorum]NHB85533.1 hypothetical protein [Tessaracoccus coleopterorum]